MQFLRVICFVLSVTVACINADCPYSAQIEKLEPCDNKQPNIFTIPKPYSALLIGDNCDISVSGCVNIHQDIKSIKCKWTAWKDVMQIHKGEKEMCGFKLGKLGVKCPMKQASSVCAKQEKMKSPVGKALGVAVGKLKAKIECTTNTGATQCMLGEGTIFRK